MDQDQLSVLVERTEAATLASLVDLMTPETALGLGARTEEVADGFGVRVAAAPDFAFLNRVLAVGLERPLTGDDLDEVIGFFRHDGSTSGTVCLQLAPQVETDDALAQLAEHGFRRGRTWAKTVREVGEPPQSRTELRVERLGAEHAGDFGLVECVGMDMPESLAPWCAAQVGAPGWHAYGAFDGDRLVAIGTLFEHGVCGQLAGAATLPEARGRGAQLALMARRIADARDLGLRWISAETGSETAEEPNPSLHNMHRAGLRTLYDRQNWIAEL